MKNQDEIQKRISGETFGFGLTMVHLALQIINDQSFTHPSTTFGTNWVIEGTQALVFGTGLLIPGAWMLWVCYFLRIIRLSLLPWQTVAGIIAILTTCLTASFWIRILPALPTMRMAVICSSWVLLPVSAWFFHQQVKRAINERMPTIE